MKDVISLKIIRSPVGNNIRKVIKVDDFPFIIGRKDNNKGLIAPDFYLDSPNKKLCLSHFIIDKYRNNISIALLEAYEIFLKGESQENFERIIEKNKEYEIKSGTQIKAGEYIFTLHIEKFDPNKNKIYCVQCQKNEIYISLMDLNEGNLADFKCKECKEENLKILPKLKVKCKKCDKDLTEFANLDNRASELRDYVEYLCDNCVDKEIGTDIYSHVGLNDFRTIKFLGKGAFGEVYEVHHNQTKRILALKIKEFSKDSNESYSKEAIRKLKKDFREIFVSSYIESKEFVKLIDARWENQKFYLFFEYMDKGNLENCAYFKNSPVFSPESLKKYIYKNICPVLDGLEYIHSYSRPSGENYVHRDIKPQNILIKTHERKYLVKIGDLGTAKDFRGAGFSDITLVSDLPIISLPFAPPEQIKDYIHPTPLNDIYSFGATLYYLLTGEFPLNLLDNTWENRNHNSNLIVEEKRIPIKDREDKIPEQLAKIIDKSLELEPKNRFSTAKEFKEALLNAFN